MYPRSNRHLVFGTLLLLSQLLVASPNLVYGQRTAPSAVAKPGGASLPVQTPVTLQVNVRANTGAPLEAGAFVKLSSSFTQTHSTAATQDASTATFPNIASGEYDVEVRSTGYRTATEHISILAAGPTYTVYVYVQPDSEPETNGRDRNAISPRLQSEIDKAVEKMHRQQFDAASAHFEKAAKIAPTNPDVQYLWGMLEYSQQRFDLARSKFEAALSIAPAHERTLVALGELDLRTGQPRQAAETLEKAYLNNGADWRMHYLLAYAYANQREYDKAELHAERAADLGKQQGGPARVLLGRILVAEGRRSEAQAAFEAVLNNFPKESFASDAKAALADLAKPPAPTLAPVVNVANPGRTPDRATLAIPAATAVPAAPVRPWAPPDVDAKEYVLAPGVACSTDQVLQSTQARTMKQLANFEKFLATEHIEHQMMDTNGNSEPVKTKDFTYLVFIRHTKSGLFFLDEERDGGENLNEFPTSLASRGLVGLGISVFNPYYEHDVTYKCEGLSAWRGQAAWEIRFEQRATVPSRIMTWRNNRGVFPVALKGRIWVAANSYDLLHIETDLREPIPSLELDRDHLTIDYGPVRFDHGNTTLWLPWYAELYMQVHGKRYHHRHTLTNYALFSVDTEHQIKAPQQTPNQN
jgi:tetratricopeptide (TPR) repeat protein